MSTYQSMDVYMGQFLDFLQEGLVIGNLAIGRLIKSRSVEHVVLAGLGGSGIGAEMVHNYLETRVDVPMVLCKDYFIPGFVNENTLFIASSYSGNTEETMCALTEAHHRGAQIVCITSGGKMKEFALEHSLGLIELPCGIPPRACVSCSFSQVLFALHAFGLVGAEFIEELKQTSIFLKKEEAGIKEESMELATRLLEKLPIIYVDQRLASIATRWRQQLNENSKVLGWERPFPEMNHNELVGWRDENANLAVLFLVSGMENERVQKRFDVCANEIKKFTTTVITINAKGEGFWQKALYLTLFGDWTSFYLAELRNVNAVEVKVIDFLKNALNS